MKKENGITLIMLIFICIIIAIFISILIINNNQNSNGSSILNVEISNFYIIANSYLENGDATVETGFISLSKESLSKNIGKYFYVGDNEAKPIDIYSFDSTSDMISDELETIKSYIDLIDFNSYFVIGIIYDDGYNITNTNMTLNNHRLNITYDAINTSANIIYDREPEKNLYLYKVQKNNINIKNESNITFKINARNITNQDLFIHTNKTQD